MFAELLAELLQPEGIYLRTERGIGELEGIQLQDGPLRGAAPHEPIVIEEDGTRFLVNLTEGQKTGFYLDQRQNRRAVARLAHGRRVLDAFCYTGGFGLHAARSGRASRSNGPIHPARYSDIRRDNPRPSRSIVRAGLSRICAGLRRLRAAAVSGHARSA